MQCSPEIEGFPLQHLPGLHNVVTYDQDVVCGGVPEGEEGLRTLRAMGIKTIVQATAAPEFLGRASYGALQGALMAPVLLAQAVTRNFKAPYRISKAPLYPYQIMIPTQLSPDRVEVECKDDTGRLEYLYLRRVGDRWMIDISSYKTQMTWERQSEFHKKSWNELNNVPSEMQTVIRRMDAGDFADAGEAMRAAEMLLPGGKLRDGEPPETTITTTDMPKSSDGPAPNPADG